MNAAAGVAPLVLTVLILAEGCSNSGSPPPAPLPAPPAQFDRQDFQRTVSWLCSLRGPSDSNELNQAIDAKELNPALYDEKTRSIQAKLEPLRDKEIDWAFTIDDLGKSFFGYYYAQINSLRFYQQGCVIETPLTSTVLLQSQPVLQRRHDLT